MYSTSIINGWTFKGGPGLLLVTRHALVPFNILSELFYLPGLYQHSCGQASAIVHSTMRLFVDMEISRDLGRAVWGFPKEMATFAWGKQSVLVRNTTGHTIFKANLTDIPLLNRPVPAWLSGIVNGSITTVQWPIDTSGDGSSSAYSGTRSSGNLGKAVGETVMELKRSAAVAAAAAAAVTAAAAAAAPVTPLPRVMPNVQEMTFFPTKLFVTNAVHPEVDSFAFTGREGQVMLMPQAPVGVIVGSPGQLSLPEPLEC
jgi:hypothetical protein